MTTERSYTPVELGQLLGRPTADITAMWLAGKFPRAFKSQETGALMIPESDAKLYLDAIPYAVKIARQAKQVVAEETPVATVTNADGEVKDMVVVKDTKEERIFGLELPPKEAAPEEQSVATKIQSGYAADVRLAAEEYAANIRSQADNYAKDIRARTDAQITVLIEQANNEAARITTNAEVTLKEIIDKRDKALDDRKAAEAATKKFHEEYNALVEKWNLVVKKFNVMNEDTNKIRTYHQNLARAAYWERFQAWAKKVMG